MWRMVLQGNIPSKKNSRVLAKVRGRMINVPSKRYKDWHKEATAQLQGELPLFDKPCRLTVQFWFENNRRTDMDNKLASIVDWLQDIGVLADDRWQILAEIRCYARGIDRDNPHAIIEIEPLDNP